MTDHREVRGLDTLRFVAALTVALSHGAGPPMALWLGKTAVWTRLFIGAYDISFDGVAAVMVFFVVSGFCIHYPPASGAPFRTLPFLARRGIRILVPLLGALALATALGAAAVGALAAVVWSIYCELIYYALYPLLRLAFRRFGVRRVLLVSCLISAAMIAVGWRAAFYWDFSPALAWLLAAPAWLLGCVLAEQVAAGATGVAGGGFWFWRLATWIYAAGANALFFHAPFRLGYPLLLFPFQFVAFGWVRAEISHFAQVKGSAVLEWCGKWSYSLYLIHNVAISVTPISASAPGWTWTIRLCLIIAGTLGFYVLVEAPSHWLARTVSRRLTNALSRGAPTASLAAP
jgi:peptidoglycan/LPS O-acetylase OafA/YrhL